jgi:hypothetical protein
MINKSKKAVKVAYEKGYRVIKGNVFFKKKEVKKRIASYGYYVFSIRMGIERQTVAVHRLVAYQKFGNRLFRKNIEVRHLDSNPLNNTDDNIEIGTPKQNSYDKSENVRVRSALIATSYVKKHNHDEIVKLYNSGVPYGELMKKFGIKSKGTISFIVNKSISSKNEM